MAPRTLRLLELPRVLEQLLGRAATDPGRDLVRALEPVTEPAVVRRRLDETSQARRFINAGRGPVFGGISDVARPLKNAAIGSVLEPGELLNVGRMAAASRRLSELIRNANDFPLLLQHAEGIVPRREVEDAVFAAIDDNSGEVKDNASMDLLRARRNIRHTQSSIQSRLRDMLADSRVQTLLQDAFVTVRDGRYCLPVKAECRGQLPGIVHDRSGSGGAFFIEPQAVVDLNNRLREHHLEEREALLAVLRKLSQTVGAAAPDLLASLAAAAALDLAFAKAELSRAMDAVAPEIAEPGAGYLLQQARHPLVEPCVPNDICLASAQCQPAPFDVMLITGPNTGGKTVVLKTLGLLTCMACCGLHLPVGAGSSLALPGAVFADIGDEQSIAQSLSTFSSHMGQIIEILRQSRAGDLVLLDEIGAGTDPDEGAALAKAVLRALQRRGVHVVATTHYGELKQFALSAERFINASVEFDSTTLRPTYRLRIGVPGASNALEISTRLGMPPELVQRARRYLGPQRAESEAAAQRLDEALQGAQQEAQDLRRERQELERERRCHEAERLKLEADSARQMEAAHREAGQLLQQAQHEAESILRELRQAPRESRQTEQARQRLRTVREKTESALIERAEQLSRPPKPSPPPREPAPAHQPLAPLPPPGSLVRVPHLGKEGVLLGEPDGSGRVEVRIGAIKVRVPVTELAAVVAPAGAAAFSVHRPLAVAEEINLIGKSTDEAIMELEKYLDDALLSDAVRVRIVHGRGTGALRGAIHRWLKRQGGVSEFHLAAANEGGDGATVVDLAGAKAAAS